MSNDRGTRRFMRPSKALSVDPHSGPIPGASPAEGGRSTATFRRVLEGSVEADRIVENEFGLAYYDLDPEAPSTQVVVLPKGPARSFVQFSAEASDAEMAGFWRLAADAVQKLGLHTGAYHMVVDQRVHADQTIPSFSVLIRKDPYLKPRGEADEQEHTVYLPRAAEAPSKEQVQALSSLFELDVYEAGQHLRSPLPRILRRAFLFEVERLVRQLSEAGIVVETVQTRALLLDLEPWWVRAIERNDEGHLVLVDADDQRVSVDPAREWLLVLGRYRPLVKQAGAGATPLPRRHSGTSKIARPQAVPFAHLYPAGGGRPYCFLESNLRDYGFLGDAQVALATKLNFKTLLDQLRGLPNCAVNEDLEANVPSQAAMDVFWSSLERGATKSPNQDVDLLSRLVYLAHDWSPPTA